MGALKVGIVTPSYNQARYLEHAIKSVLAQTYPVTYYSVCDAESTDGSREILERYRNNLSECVIERDLGQADCLNRAFSRMPPEISIMAYLNSDDVLVPDAVEKIVGWFTDHPDANFIAGSRRLMGPGGIEGPEWRSFARSAEDFYISCGLNQECCFWRRSLYNAAGGRVDASYRFALDYELWTRMADAGWRVLYSDSVLGHFRLHPASKSQKQMLSTGLDEINRLRTRKGLAAISAKKYAQEIRRIQKADYGAYRFIIWRLRNYIFKKFVQIKLV